jgi:hypothetical protein
MNPRLTVFGPANGSVAYSFPDFRKEDDDSLFLSSSEVDLRDGATCFRLSRPRGGGARFRIGVYKQVFEPNMNRGGHFFGAVFDFQSEVSAAGNVVGTLLQLLEVIEVHCCREGHFCDASTFAKFLESEIAPSFEGIVEQVTAGGARGGVVSLPQPAPATRRLYVPLGSNLPRDLSSVTEWFAVDPSSILCESLLAAAPTSGTPGPLYERVISVQDVSLESTHFLYETCHALSRSLEHALGTSERLTGESAVIARNLDILNEEISFQKTEIDFLKKEKNHLEQKLRRAESKESRSQPGVSQALRRPVSTAQVQQAPMAPPALTQVQSGRHHELPTQPATDTALKYRTAETEVGFFDTTIGFSLLCAIAAGLIIAVAFITFATFAK